MKLLLKILFFIFAIFSTNISESKVVLFGEVVTKIGIIENAIENKNEVTINSENDFGISCKSKNDLVDYRYWSIGVEADAAKTSTSLVKTGTQFSKHSLERLAQRGVTQDMAELAISKGQKFYDPLNKSINYVLPNGFASGKSLLVGTNPLTGEVTTVIRSSKNLINSRFIPIK
jgi:hypothetical protein